VLQIEPVTLEGKWVRLEPLDSRHATSLAAQVDPELFRFFGAITPREATESACTHYVEGMRSLPNVLPFAVVLRETGAAIGSTSYMDIRREHDGLEIGMTWYGAPYHRSAVNPECKLLLLEHAFERLGCIRVQLKTDLRNVRSQRAIEKLGALKEGVLRNHGIMPDGYVRDTVMYSILPEEWPEVKARLLERLDAFR
jgi:RimJ/RimL family protein N-acetyltransferase